MATQKRKKRVYLSKLQKAKIKAKITRANGRRGIINELAAEYDVTRKTISDIKHMNIMKLQTINEDIQVKQIEKKTLEYEINTYKERVGLINLLKQVDIVPILHKIQLRHKQQEQMRRGEITEITAPTITDDESIKLKQSAIAIEQLLKGIDASQKLDVHFHITKVVNVIQNMSNDEADILIPQLKTMLCHKCPLYAKYQKGFK